MTTSKVSTAIRAALLLAAAGLLTGLSAQAADRLAKARQHIDAGQDRAAVIELKNALQKDPGDREARLLLGQLYLKARDGAAAEKELRRAAELDADPARWRLPLVEALLLQGKFSDALDRLDAAGELPAADQAQAAALRGDASLGLQRIDEAEEAYKQALALDPGNERAGLGGVVLALARDQAEVATSAADELLTRYPRNVEALLIRAELHRRAAELDAAAERFTQALAERPDDLRALHGRATTQIARNDLAAARADLDRADAVQKDLPMTRYLRGLAAFQAQQWDQAAEHLQRVLAAVPGHLQSQLLMGIISYSKNELRQAEEYLSRVVAALPGNPQAVKVLAATRIKLRQPDKAVEVLAPLARSTPDAQLYALLGSAYLLKGDQDQGQEWLSRAVEITPDAAALRTQLALTLLAEGETDKAITELQSAVELGQDILQADVLLVLAHLRNREFDAALRASEALEARMPESPIPFNLTGLAYLAMGEQDKAVERFNRALGIDPQFVTAELNLARIDLAKSDWEAARARYQAVLGKEPRHLGAMLGLAALAERDGDQAGMVDWLVKARDANPGAVQPGVLLVRYHLAQGEGLKALSVANDLASRFPNDAQALEVLARAQSLAGETSNAARSFEQLAQLLPQNAEVQYLLGGAKWAVEDLAGARTAFRRASELQPDLLKVYVALASLELQAERFGEALDLAKRVQRDFPDSSAGYQLEGAVHLRQGRAEEAVPAFEAAYARERTSPLARQLAQAQADRGQKGEGIRVLEGWLADNPEDRAALGMLAMYYQTEGRDPEAIGAYERLAQLGEPNLIVLNNLAWLYQKAGDPRALETARQAYDLDPNRAEVADTYGWILVQGGKAQEGLSILQQAYVSYPTHPEIGYHLAVALSKTGRTDESVKLLRRLLKDNPDFEQAAEARALLAELER